MLAATAQIEQSASAWRRVTRAPRSPATAKAPRPLAIVHEAAGTPRALHHGVVLLGNFDGFHQGHQALLARGRMVADRMAAPLGVMSVEPHPRQLFAPHEKPFRLTSPATKWAILEERGFDFAFSPNFDSDFAGMSANDFIHDILVRGLRVRHVVAGHNFRFGRRRRGTTELLRHFGRRHGFGVSRVKAQLTNEVVTSSSLIRNLIDTGDIAAANAVLGHRWVVEIDSGSVQAAIDSEWRFRLNSEQLLPPTGRYSVRLVSLAGGRRSLGWGQITLSADQASNDYGWAHFSGKACPAKQWGDAPALEFVG